MDDWLILGLVFLGLFGGHWMRWRVCPFLVDERGDLLRPLAYTYGCGWILAGFLLWSLMQSNLVSARSAVLFLVWDMIAAGLGTMAPRVVRWVERKQILEGDVIDYEQAIQR